MKKFSILLIILNFLVSLTLFPILPQMIPTHWNIKGVVDSYMPKYITVILFPAMTLALFILFRILPAFDPKKEKYQLFKREWEIFQTAIIIFFVWINLITLYASLNPSLTILPWLFFGMGVLFVILGKYMSKIRQNYFIGIKTPWALANEENWNKTHRFASWTFVIAGLGLIGQSIFLSYVPGIIFGSIILAALLPYTYSFLIYKNYTGKMKYILLAIGLIGLALFSLRIASGDEDTWVQDNGTWVKHGNPAQGKYYYPITEYDKRLTLRSYGKYLTIQDKSTVVCGAAFTGFHVGDDLEVTPQEEDIDVPVYSVTEGQVVIVARVSGYGELIVIRYPEFLAYYGHVTNILVKQGDKVVSGQKLAILGKGCSAQTDGERKHLHFALSKESNPDVRGYVTSQTELTKWLDPKIELQMLVNR